MYHDLASKLRFVYRMRGKWRPSQWWINMLLFYRFTCWALRFKCSSRITKTFDITYHLLQLQFFSYPDWYRICTFFPAISCKFFWNGPSRFSFSYFHNFLLCFYEAQISHGVSYGKIHIPLKPCWDYVLQSGIYFPLWCHTSIWEFMFTTFSTNIMRLYTELYIYTNYEQMPNTRNINSIMIYISDDIISIEISDGWMWWPFLGCVVCAQTVLHLTLE